MVILKKNYGFLFLLGPSFFLIVHGLDFYDGCRGKTKMIEAKGTMEGTITSPGFSDGAYPPSINCSYQIETFKGFVIKVQFAEFRLEVSNKCEADEFVIREPNEDGTETKLIYCGMENPEDYQTVGSVIKLDFRSDEIGSTWGYRVRWQAFVEKNFCYKGTFQCRNRRCVDNYYKCNGDDECLDGTDEENCTQSTSEPEECGHPMITPKTFSSDRISGGQESRPGSWPWMVDLHDIAISPAGHICGGTLLNSEWVITAAHCFTENRKASQWKVIVGNHEKFHFNEGQRTRYVKRLVFYNIENDQFEKYGLYDKKHDVALVQLSNPVQMSRFVQPACLPIIDYELKLGSICFATGWGATKGSGDSDVLKQVVVPVLRNKICEEVAGDIFDPKTMICGGSLDAGNGLCPGDNGGPLICQLGVNGTWYITGVTSIIPGNSGTNSICGLRNTPTVFNKISKKVDWINKIIKRSV